MNQSPSDVNSDLGFSMSRQQTVSELNTWVIKNMIFVVIKLLLLKPDFPCQEDSLCYPFCWYINQTQMYYDLQNLIFFFLMWLLHCCGSCIVVSGCNITPVTRCNSRCRNRKTASCHKLRCTSLFLLVCQKHAGVVPNYGNE